MTYGNKTVGVTAYLRDSGNPEFMPDLMTVTQPNLELLTDTISGAGINGEIDMPTYSRVNRPSPGPKGSVESTMMRS